MHERTCDNNLSKKKVERKSAITLQVGRGVNERFQFIESALGGVMQVWRHEFSESENKDVYESLHSTLMNEAHELVLKATGLFKWQVGLKVVFHKADNPEELTDPPAFFQTDPFASYNKYDDDVWEIVKEQLEQQIDNYERNGSGWVVSHFVSLDVNFYEIENTLQKIRA